MSNQFPEIYFQYFGIIIISILLLGFIITILLLYQRKKLIQEKEIHAIKSNFEKELLQIKLEIQEDVLKNVSMEIHDNIGQIMLLANINISILQQMQLSPNASELISDIKKMLGNVSEDISQISRSLNSDRITELGVFKSILTELNILAQKSLFVVNVNDQLEISGKELPHETQLLIFRMFQEISNNLIKHSKATVVNVIIGKKEKGIVLEVNDNGIGFDFSSTSGNNSEMNGIGLRSLAERARLFGGSIDIQSILHKGTSISIFIPIV